MQSLISNDCVKKYYLYVVLIRNNIRCINNIQEMELHIKNVINELKLILEKFRNKCHQNWITFDGEKLIQNLIAD
jgi:hypothetical protein